MPKKSIRDDFEDAKLKLEILKENFEYQEFFKYFINWYEHRKPDDAWPILEFERFGLSRLGDYISRPDKFSELLDLLNPEKNTDGEKEHRHLLPRLFYQEAVSLADPTMQGCFAFPEREKLAKAGAFGGKGSPVWYLRNVEIATHERVYRVDLRKKKKQILSEFEKYVAAALSNLKEDRRRQRAETRFQLDIWKMRRQKMTFAEISSNFHISADVAKKAFYRAYEITQCKKYDIELFKTLKRVKKADLKNLCATCAQRQKCADMCPDVLRFVNQDYVKRREILEN